MLALRRLAEFVQSPRVRRRDSDAKRHVRQLDRHCRARRSRDTVTVTDYSHSQATVSQCSQLPSDGSDVAGEEHLYDVPKRVLGEASLRAVVSRVVHVTLEKTLDECFGLELGEQLADDGAGLWPSGAVTRPLVVTSVTRDGPAHREGTIQPGDRLLALNSVSLHGLTVGEAQCRLRAAARRSVLSVQYDVNRAAVSSSDCSLPPPPPAAAPLTPLVIEVDSSRSTRGLGVELAAAGDCALVTAIRAGSVAERIGVLRVGDRILMIGDLNLERIPIAEVENLLNHPLDPSLRLLVLPGTSALQVTTACSKSTESNLSTQHFALHQAAGPAANWPDNSGTRCRPARQTALSHDDIYDRPPAQSLSAISRCAPAAQCYGEWDATTGRRHTCVVLLERQQWRHQPRHSTGLRLISCEDSPLTSSGARGQVVPLHEAAAAAPAAAVLVGHIESDSVAAESGVVQTGDQIVAVNGVNVLGWRAARVERLIDQTPHDVSLTIAFLVSDTVLPRSGEFSVRLQKHGTSLGIVLRSSSSSSPSTSSDCSCLSLTIADITPGSVAYRSGTIAAGDQLCSIDGCPVRVMQQAVQLMRSSGPVVTLGIRKRSAPLAVSGEGVTRLVFSVELEKQDGTLGINFAGSEVRSRAIHVTSLRNGGAAARSGQLVPGDRLLAVSGTPVQQLTLSQTSALIGRAGPRVTLLLERIEPTGAAAVGASCADNGTHSDIGPPGAAVENNTNTNTSTCLHQVFSPSALSSLVSSTNSSGSCYGQAADAAAAEAPAAGATSLYPSRSHEYYWNHLSSRGAVPSHSDGPVCAGAVESSPSATVSGYHSGSETVPPGSCSSSASTDVGDGCRLVAVTVARHAERRHFGLSLAGAVCEPGVYIGQLEPHGPADSTGQLRPGDRLVQVNGVDTSEMCCSQVVPLIASTTTDSLHLTVSRPIYSQHTPFQLESLSDVLPPTVATSDVIYEGRVPSSSSSSYDIPPAPAPIRHLL